MKKLIRSSLLLLALPLAACSYFDSSSNVHLRDQAYLEARTAQPLRIPPGVSSSKIHNEYPVSNRTYPPKDLKVSLVPPGL
jgi:uncharacterized lipoprotein